MSLIKFGNERTL